MFSKKYRGRLIRYSLLAANAAVLIFVVGFVAQKPQSGGASVDNAIFSSESANAIVSPLDGLSSADIAVNIARVTRLEESTSVVNKADTVNAQLSIAPSDDVITAKPQVIATALKSRADIQTYVTVKGDTVSGVAQKFDVTSDTIRWSNDLDGENLNVGTHLVISPINGVVYKVAGGDSVDGILSKYRVNKQQLIAFNDIETGGLPVGQYIVLPNGAPAALVAATPSVENVASTSGFAWGGSSPAYGSNGYDYGYCTWYAANRRAGSGRPIPSNLGNASTWKILAQRAGLSVGNSPAAGAVIWTPPRDYYGHVGYVEKVLPNGSVVVSEMNVAGWGVVSRKTLTASQAAGYGYIY